LHITYLEPAEALASAIHDVYAKTADKKTKYEAEVFPLYLIRQVGTEPRAQDPGHGEDNASAHIDVSVPVIFDHCGESKRW